MPWQHNEAANPHSLPFPFNGGKVCRYQGCKKLAYVFYYTKRQSQKREISCLACSPSSCSKRKQFWFKNADNQFYHGAKWGKQCKSSISSTKALPRVTRHTQSAGTVPPESADWHQSQRETFDLCILQKNHRGKTFYLWFMISRIIFRVKCTNMKYSLKLITPAVCDPQSFISSLCNRHNYSHYFDLEGIYTIITYCHLKKKLANWILLSLNSAEKFFLQPLYFVIDN